MFRKLIRTRNEAALTIPRITLGVVFFVHGAQKLLGWWGGQGYSATMSGMTQMGFPSALVFLAIMAEFFGGLGLIIGLLGRVAAFGIACVMAVAVAKVHAAHGFFMNWSGTQGGEGFEFHLLAVAIGIAVIVGGSGALSVDRALMRPAPQAPDIRHRKAA